VEKQIVAKAEQRQISLIAASEELLAEKQPSKQFVDIEQLAGVVLFLCSESASQITGISLPVDGGWTAQ
jgi:3-hydroxybutyrate dehydrogenase